MQLEFVVYKDDKFVNTYNGEEIDFDNGFAIKRFEKKNFVKLFDEVIDDNTFFKYDVKINDNTVILSVYEGTFNGKNKWKEVYNVFATFGVKGIIENGDCDLDFWHELFATDLGYGTYNEENVEKFSLVDSPMEVVRNVFSFNMQTNVFLFFKKYASLRKIKQKKFDTKIFDIPQVKINRNVGKIFDGKFINYAVQREVELDGEVFFDITVISGLVENGIMDIEKKHRYFLTEDYAYSPDNGPIGVFVSDNIYGNVYDQNMKKKYPGLMLDKYDGKYYYQYFFAKEFIPCFEILAKAGLSDYADLMLENYYTQKINWDSVNIYGKNDKEIFGFKLSKLKNIDINICYSKYNWHTYEFPNFMRKVRFINERAPYLLDVKDIDESLFNFIERRLNVGVSMKDIEYIKSIGTGNATLYADYLSMCQDTGKYSGGLYPNNLRHEHDVMVTYVNQLKEAKNNKQFEEVVSMPDYLDNLYENDKYCILAPRTANDLVNESYQLSHCVRTYIKGVATGSTKIYFLREKEKKAKSLVTIEVRRGSICQARGKGNRKLTNEEEKFVSEWAQKKKLTQSYTYYW